MSTTARKPDRRAQLAAVVADIRSRVRNLDIAMADRRDDANVVVTLVRDRDLAATIRALYGTRSGAPHPALARAAMPVRLPQGRKLPHPAFRRVLVADAGDFVFYDCVYEELLQSLGPINDDTTVPWTMFNDDVQMGFFDLYDQYLLNILYDPRIRAGMTREAGRALLPEMLPQVRAWVDGNNGMKP